MEYKINNRSSKPDHKAIEFVSKHGSFLIGSPVKRITLFGPFEGTHLRLVMRRYRLTTRFTVTDEEPA